MEYIIEDILDIAPYLPIGGFFGVTALVAVLSFQTDRGKERRIGYAIGCGLFVAHFVVMMEVALLSREPGTRDSLDLVLFSTWGETMQSRAYVIENVIMFIPYGILLPIVTGWMKKPWRTVAAGFVVSVLIEAIQYVTKMGYCQLDDVVMNVAGTCLGYGLCRIAQMCCRRYNKNNS
ncbi:VanZ family protein [Hespellia stercorisuis]|uniref:VanZ like family protein n=1 Tax=Hespellia stercorisuis DSM 15480 TaxID=1121950 RepID=A0A1M6S7W5_9FIRM|nr:VanZ family protein [Hespellia stercorisuis]SHK40793.1 VanZ like family protein [Hespellia stercorisuis DSM 15480]